MELNLVEKSLQEIQDKQACEKELQAVLAKYNCMMVFKETKINGQLIRTEFAVEKIKMK
jgi:hypothetical protein